MCFSRLFLSFIRYNNENHIIDCKAEEICTKKEMTFTLENLSSFTNYKIYIVAYTNAAPSEHSNDINVKTLVGSKYSTL